MTGYRDLFARARAAALGTTVHTGETAYTAVPGVLAVLKELAPTRIGHGVAAAHSEEAVREAGRVGHGAGDLPELEPAHARGARASPSSGRALRTFEDAGVRYTINTDGPYLLNTHLRREYQMLIESNILSDAEAERSVAVARAATFIR